ncbi:MAG: FHA domain-containing protein [Flammeovirgaceae bacterium]
MFVLNFNNVDKIRIGRGHDSDLRINDNSVSRTHSCIQKDYLGRYFIEDCTSKFGTLVQI